MYVSTTMGTQTHPSSLHFASLATWFLHSVALAATPAESPASKQMFRLAVLSQLLAYPQTSWVPGCQLDESGCSHGWHCFLPPPYHTDGPCQLLCLGVYYGRWQHHHPACRWEHDGHKVHMEPKAVSSKASRADIDWEGLIPRLGELACRTLHTDKGLHVDQLIQLNLSSGSRRALTSTCFSKMKAEQNAQIE